MREKIVEKMMPKIKFPSNEYFNLYVNNGDKHNDKLYKIDLHKTIENAYVFNEIKQSKLLFGGDWYEWKEQNYPYIPYEMFYDELCTDLINEQTKKVKSDLQELDDSDACRFRR